jgi:hypothetical protein
MHARKMHAYETHGYETHGYEMHAREIHARKMYARRIRAYEGFCEELARQNVVARLSQLQLRFRRRHIWVSVIAVVSKDHYLGRCTVCLGTSAHRPCFDLSACLQSAYLVARSKQVCIE